VHAAVRYYDAVAKRPGLPPGVAALVDEVGDEQIHVQLVNTDLLEAREVVLQAGGCAEHEFTYALSEGQGPAPLAEGHGVAPLAVDGRYLKVALGPGAHASLRLGLKRFAHTPTYAQPAL
jgi:hypothetical protein